MVHPQSSMDVPDGDGESSDAFDDHEHPQHIAFEQVTEREQATSIPKSGAGVENQ